MAGRTRRCSVARTNRYSKKLLRRNGGRDQRRRDGDVRDGDDGPEGSDGAFAQVLGDMRVFFRGWDVFAERVEILQAAVQPQKRHQHDDNGHDDERCLHRA